MTNPNAVADVSPLIIPAGEKFEPTHVGRYDIPNAQGATGRVARRTKLGEDGNQIGAHSALYIPHWNGSFPEFILGWTMGPNLTLA